MSKPHPIEHRSRVAASVDEGHGHREAARHFRVSPKFVNDLVKLRRETGSLAPRQGATVAGAESWAVVAGWIEARIAVGGDITLDELVAELAEIQSVNGPPRHGLARAARSRTTEHFHR